MLQQRELRGMGVRVRAVAALLRVFLSAFFGARQSSFQVSFLQPGNSSLRVLPSGIILTADSPCAGAV